MPQTVVEGSLVDADGNPAPRQTFTVVLSNLYAETQAITDVARGTIDADKGEYAFIPVTTGPQGEFSCSFPGRSYMVGGAHPLFIPSEDAAEGFSVGLRTQNGQAAHITVRGDKVAVYGVAGSRPRLVSLARHFPCDISATVTRSKTLDVLRIAMRQRNADALATAQRMD